VFWFVTAGTFLIQPNPALIIWTLVIVAAIVMGGVTAAKGRWGWFVIGLLTGGLVWLVSGFLEATPGSLWARRIRPAKGR
jgi:hypothetical protein